jgi:alpha-tubulin suppressor-like RCC1 family protein
VPGLPPARSLSAGVQHTCALDDTGAAYCWGRNDRGQLGTNTPGDHSPVPAAVDGGHAFESISAGGFTCALTSAGVAYCWGHVADELSFGVRPLAVPAFAAFNSLSVGSAHACAVTAEGRGYCLGSMPGTNPPTLWTGVGTTLNPHPIAGPL